MVQAVGLFDAWVLTEDGWYDAWQYKSQARSRRVCRPGSPRTRANDPGGQRPRSGSGSYAGRDSTAQLAIKGRRPSCDNTLRVAEHVRRCADRVIGSLGSDQFTVTNAIVSAVVARRSVTGPFHGIATHLRVLLAAGRREGGKRLSASPILHHHRTTDRSIATSELTVTAAALNHATGFRAHTAVIIQHCVQYSGSFNRAAAASKVAASISPLSSTRPRTSAKNN